MVIIALEVREDLGVHEKIGEPTVVEGKGQPDTAMNGGEFYGAKKEEETKPNPQAVAPRAANANTGNIYPIEGLSLFAHKWTIKARVSAKSEIKTWHKSTGEGKLFSVNLLDESGEIKATGFNDEVDAFYDLLQEGQVYFISTPAKVVLAKKQFSNLSNEYEITFNRDTKVEKAEDQSSVPQVRFNFCTIQELQGVEKDNTVDVIGVLKEAGEVSEIISKKNSMPFQKRELTIVDDTGFSVRVTIWGKTANSFDAPPESVIAFKGTKVSDFGGKSLSLLSSGSMAVDPDIQDAHRLKGWYASDGRNNTFANHSNLQSMDKAAGRPDDTKTISQVKDENMGMDGAAYYSVKATIVFARQETFCYAACANANCNKKVTEIGDGQWQCENCNVAHDKPEYRYILSISVADHTGHQWLTCFDETGKTLVGMSANELMELKENDNDRFTEAFERVNCKKLNFRCRAKMETFGETPK